MRRAVAILLLLWPISSAQAVACAVRCALTPTADTAGAMSQCPGMSMPARDSAPAPKNLPCPRQAHYCANHHAAVLAKTTAVHLASFAVLPGLAVFPAPSGIAVFGSSAFAVSRAPDPSPHRFHLRV
ncbi:MAG: hypothetical protein ACRD2H_10350 [Terriglobales bacterium]